MIDSARLEHDSDGTVETWTLILEDDFGSHAFLVDPEVLDGALAGWRSHMLEGEAVRAERALAGVSWAGYRDGFACVDPEEEWVEMLREQADLARKREREAA